MSEASIDNQAKGRISISDLSFHYSKSDSKVLKSFNLEILPGEAVSLVGPSGCGKSTLLHLIAGLKMPSSGNVTIDGIKISKPTPRCNMMFQEATLYPWMSVFQNVGFGLKIKGITKQQLEVRVTKLLKLLKLNHLSKRNTRQLSGGQQQRVALARSLATNPSVILLDEPFSSLDTFTRNELQVEIREICKGQQITLVIVTHDFNEAINMSDRIIMLSDSDSGKIVAEVSNHETFLDGKTEDSVAAQKTNMTKLWENSISNNYEI
tara:strand:- start:6366 stop:7160 length:795 start_codon:yes stop_codon:yes gene_type:complete